MLASPHLDSPPSAELRPVQGSLWAWFGAFADDEAAASRHLLLLRFALLNLVALALLGAAWLKGWVAMVLEGDVTRIVTLIAVVFVVGLLDCARKLWRTSAEIDELAGAPTGQPPSVPVHLRSPFASDGQGRTLAASTLKLKLTARIAPVRHVANSLVFLGLIGTVIGFIIALSGVDPTTASDVNAIGPMVSTLISGMSVALYTTLVGAILNIWLMLNYRLLEGGTIRLLTAIVELRERHA